MQRLIVQPSQIQGNHLTLTADQQHYLYRVLRLATGDGFLALDGHGQQWVATLGKSPELAHLDSLESAISILPNVTLAIALPKGSGFDDVVRQTTELGVATLQPLITQRTLHQPNPKKLDRWQRIAAEATEQCERPQLPSLSPPKTWANYLRQDLPPQRWICLARGDSQPLLTIAQASDPNLDTVIATGPEGGWTDSEIEAALAAGFQPVSLGPTVLRAVTAPIVALSLALAGLSR
ncbi:16S rRNA (uracil(1498)-N(3))-methyltransferase [Leptolyngbya sp. BL0902]|uniref:16S rRNA (uracil(1498)-N(3))-methyltransferase n=1 Tax=Leptolyngbya sp. BL0902 TaxID=1115757 RepID=UPI0018E7DC9F|nr:16S rRNA (uracil(1498)-N(3))-methyltransferase [Leptolyngbya sp. BL0902]QQE67023.1 16S rRNA (uracil(1498)-N(3))-methyltransferase [Leptolyngbya sp. BL0902]